MVRMDKAVKNNSKGLGEVSHTTIPATVYFFIPSTIAQKAREVRIDSAWMIDQWRFGVEYSRTSTISLGVWVTQGETATSRRRCANDIIVVFKTLTKGNVICLQKCSFPASSEASPDVASHNRTLLELNVLNLASPVLTTTVMAWIVPSSTTPFHLGTSLS